MAPIAFPPRFERITELPGAGRERCFAAHDRVTGQACRLVASSARLALRQAHALGLRLASPHVAGAIDEGTLPDGGWYRAEAMLAPVGKAAIPDLAVWLPGWLSGLADLHAAGRVHAELHPGALGFDPEGRACLAGPGRGLGIAELGEPLSGDHPAWAYMAPELWGHGRVDARTDLFMLGAVALTWLAPAVATPRTAEELVAILDALPGEAAAWGDWLGGMLAPLMSERFASAGEALASLPLPAPVAGLPEPAGRVTPFVGRRRELSALLAALDEAVDTLTPRVVMLTGEAGMGKSRLMDELRQRARLRGCEVVRVAASAGAAPYSACVPLIDALLLRVPRSTRAALAPVLATLLPELGELAPALEPRAARSRLVGAIADLLEAASTQPGLLVCLDDWHAADPASQALLDFLCRTLPSLPLCLVVACREAPSDGGSPESPRASRLPLSGLGQREALALWQGVRPGFEPSGGFEACCDGNPALLEQTVLACRSTEDQTAVSALLTRETAPAALATMWRSRLLSLSANAKTLALAAAVAGPGASLVLLAGVSGLDEEAFLGAHATLADAGLLAMPAEHVLALSEAPEELAAMHARALAYHRLALQMGERVSTARLARHAVHGGRVEEAAHYALAAAREALAIFALPEAEAFLAEGERALAGCPEAPAAWRIDYLIARGDLERFHARATDAEKAYRAALAGIEARPGRRLEVLTSLGIALNLNSRGDEAAALFREALALDAPEAARARPMAALARLHVRMGDAEAAARTCREALALKGIASAHRGEALGLLGLVCVAHGGDVVEGLEHLALAQQLARETGDRLALSNACMLAGNAHLGLGALDAAREQFTHYALLCQELGLPDEALCASLNLAQVAHDQGRYAEAWQRAQAGARAANESGNRIYEAFGRSLSGLAAAQLGRLAEAEEALASAVTVAEPLGEGLAVQVAVARLELTVFLGRFGAAEEQALALRKRMEAAGAREWGAAIALSLAQVYVMSGEVAAAVEQLRLARVAAENGQDRLLMARIALTFGQVAAASGQLAVARARGLEALGLAEGAGAQLIGLRAHLLVAQTSWQLGQPQETDLHLARAQQLADGLGSPHWQAVTWLAQSRLRPDGASLRLKAATFIQLYLQQLPPRARQEFMNWPERRDMLTGRGTNALELRVSAPPPRRVADPEGLS